MPEQADLSTKRGRRSTRLAVRITDKAARSLITVGGIGTIAAVSGVFLFLMWVVWPLFTSASVQSQHQLQVPDPQQKLQHLVSDEYRVLGVGVLGPNHVVAMDLRNGKILSERDFVSDQTPTASWFSPNSGQGVLGFADGTLRLVDLGFETRFIEPEDAPADLAKLNPDQLTTHGDAIVQKTPSQQLRMQSLKIDLADPIHTDSQTPIVLIDRVDTSAGPTVAALAADGSLEVERVRKVRNLMTGRTTFRTSRMQIPFELTPDQPRPIFLGLNGLGDWLAIVWPDGRLESFDLRNRRNIQAAESIDLLPEDDATITSLGFVVGRNSLAVGDDKGRTTIWFRIADPEGQSPDGKLLTRVRSLEHGPAAVSAIASSSRQRVLAIGYANGLVRVANVTTAETLTEAQLPGGAVRQVAIAPKNDGLLAASDSQIVDWDLKLKYPEVTFRSLFTPLWYEGYQQPAHVWQSSSASDANEPKYGMIPLIFGTLKATFYSMLFGTPLAILAALFTSEFLHPSLKSKIKPTIELMASLPSVVLGFLGGLVIAPFVENWIPAMLTVMLSVPICFLTGAYIWQMLPRELTLRYEKWRFVLMFFCLPAGLGAAVLFGPIVERLLFAGDIRRWLDGQIGSGVGGWTLLLLPVSAIVVAGFYRSIITPTLRELARQRAAVISAIVFATACVAAIGLAAATGGALTAIGFDPREPWTLGMFNMSPVQTYVQRNALIVGFVMGFAIIPIIYTIAEDALSAVPDHLRSASLGAGATPWQTAVRIVIPTAMSGLFSAVMIGLGRAVGETMIVLMAAGNTPVLEANIFNGFRTLSANIAVEMPEAPPGEAHYRTLYLAALVLFVMTFFVNTLAEIVRLRFRKRAVEL